MAELAESTGGKIYRQAWDLKDILKDLRK